MASSRSRSLAVLVLLGWACTLASPQTGRAEWRSGGSGAVSSPAVGISAAGDSGLSPAGFSASGLTLSGDLEKTIGGLSSGSGVPHLSPSDPKPHATFRVWNERRHAHPQGYVGFLVHHGVNNGKPPIIPWIPLLIFAHHHCPHVPEPSSMVLAGIGGLAVGVSILRRRTRSASQLPADV